MRDNNAEQCLRVVQVNAAVERGLNLAELTENRAVAAYEIPAAQWRPIDRRLIGSAAELCQTISNCPYGCLSAVSHADFSQHVLDVLFDCFITDIQRIGDLLIGLTLRQMLEHLVFALRQWNIEIGNRPN